MFTSSFIQTNGITLHVAQAGDPAGRPVVLLHGFPDFHYGWRQQVPALAAAGFRLLLPDQRGYNLSDRPAAVSAYRPETLVDDIIGLLDAFGYEQVDMIGHDWGGAIGWGLAGLYPERVRRLVIMNLPHPAVFLDFVRRNPGQIRRSWYFFLFQLPWLPEWFLTRRRAAALVRSLRRSGRPDTFTAEDLDRYRRAWLIPGAMRGMIHWYRAMPRYTRPGDPRFQTLIDRPVLILWGRQDAALDPAMAQASLAYCRQADLQYFDSASHWVQRDAAAAVNAAICRFLTAA